MTTITDTDALKSKANFTSYVEEHSQEIIEEALKGYPQHLLHIIYPQLTPSADGLMAAVGNLVDEQKAYIFYFVANEKEEVFKVIKVLNQNFTDYCGIFVFKAELNNDKIEFKTILKPNLTKKPKRIVNEQAPAKIFQKKYWKRYFELCDSLESDIQVNPKAQHLQYIPMGKRGVQIYQIVNTKLNCVSTEIFINEDKSIFNKLLEHKLEIEEELGYLEWQPLEGKKSSRIRKTLGVDISKDENLDRAIQLHIQTAEDFKKVFSKYLV